MTAASSPSTSSPASAPAPTVDGSSDGGSSPAPAPNPSVDGPALGPATAADGLTPWPAADEARYRSSGYWGGDTLPALLSRWVAEHPDRVALRSGDDALTYHQLDHRARHLAGGLLALGVEPGDRVVVQLPNTTGFVVAVLAALRCGAVPILTLPGHRRREISHFVSLSGAVAYLAPDVHGGFDHRELGRELLQGPTTLRHVLIDGDPGDHLGLDEVAASGRPVEGDGPASPGDTALLLVSGGTTGRPKLIPRTHRDYAYNAAASAGVCGLGPDDVYLVALPAGHNFPLACPGLLGALGVGATVVMAPVPSPDVAFGLIEQHGVTVTALVPPLVRLWCDSAAHDRRDRSSLRLLQVGGAKLDAGLARRVGPELGCRLQQVFGMAEGLLNYTRLDDDTELAATTQGRPLSPDDEVLIVDRDGHPVPDGTVGELLTRGPYTIRGYYRAPEANAVSFSADGHYRTGDLVRRLPTGHLVVEGRIKEVVNRGGENVPAGELEDALVTHPDLAQVAVVGLPHEVLGEAVCAVVTPAPGVTTAPTLREIRAYLTGLGVARFLLPDRLDVTDRLPTTAVGKIDKQRIVTDLTPTPQRRNR